MDFPIEPSIFFGYFPWIKTAIHPEKIISFPSDQSMQVDGLNSLRIPLMVQKVTHYAQGRDSKVGRIAGMVHKTKIDQVQESNFVPILLHFPESMH